MMRPGDPARRPPLTGARVREPGSGSDATSDDGRQSMAVRSTMRASLAIALGSLAVLESCRVTMRRRLSGEHAG